MQKSLALVLLILLLPSTYAAPLLVAFDTPGLRVSTAEKRELSQRLEQVLNAELSIVNAEQRQRADILLTTSKHADNWHLTRVVVGYIPPFIAVSNKPFSVQPSLRLAQLERAYTLQGENVQIIPTDSDVLSLLNANRFDVIVDVASNLVQHDIKSQLFRQRIYSGSHIRMAVKSAALIANVEQQVATANTELIKLISDDVPDINVHLIAKTFDTERYIMQESAEDLAFFSLLQDRLPQFSLHPIVSSAADAALALEDSVAGCIVNYRKREPSTKLLYSMPTQLYLGPRLYLPTSSTLRQDIENFIANGKLVSFADIFSLNKRTHIATLDMLKKDLPETQLQNNAHHFLPVTRFDSAIMLLQRQRVDAVWLYPVMFRFSLAQPIDAEQFSSFYLMESGAATPVHFACNRSQQTMQLVQELNRLLKDASFQHELITQNIVGLTQADEQDYISQFRQLLQRFPAESELQPSKLE